MKLSKRWLKDWTRMRGTTTGKTATGAPTTDTAEATIKAHLVFLRPGEAGDYRDDVDAYVLCDAGLLKVGDVIKRDDFGSFEVLEERPKPYRGFVRFEVKAA